MVSHIQPQAVFPNSAKDYDNYYVKNKTKVNYNDDNIYLQEELLEQIDEMNEDQINLLKDADLLQTIAMTENYIENKFDSNQGNKLKNSDIYKSNILSKSKDKL